MIQNLRKLSDIIHLQTRCFKDVYLYINFYVQFMTIATLSYLLGSFHLQGNSPSLKALTVTPPPPSKEVGRTQTTYPCLQPPGLRTPALSTRTSSIRLLTLASQTNLPLTNNTICFICFPQVLTCLE